MNSKQLGRKLNELVAEGVFTKYYVEAGQLSSDLRFDLGNAADFEYFDLASLSKALVTSPLVFQLVVENQISLEDSLGDFKGLFPEKYRNILVADLLSHQSGLPAWRNFWIDTLPRSCNSVSERYILVRQVLERISTPNLGENPKKVVYSDIGFIILGVLLEHVTGKPLDKIWEDFAKSFPRMNLTEKLIFSNHLDGKATIPTGYCNVRGTSLDGLVHDENCAALGGVSGHCGLFGQPKSVGQFIRSMWQSQNGRLFFEKNYADGWKTGRWLGLRPGDDVSSEVFGNGRSFGHLGFTGCAFWIDLDRETYAVFLTNRTIAGRVNLEFKYIRRSVFSTVQELL
ncbi:MAG: serine hydrolase [Pseudobacteriovorax sp.]|nr:serine hydrolase [Pseudobacteriovorax sp.]